jgi:hypothetical protein
MSDKKLHAKHLFFQTELNKTQIAEVLNISRRTLHYWIREGNWQRLKNASEHMPAIIAENCYHIMAHLTNSYLSERRLTNPVTPKEIDALHKLTLTINKLKNRSALNESVEMFAYFIDKLKAKAPEVADQITPFVEEYLEERASVFAGDIMPPHFNDMGYIPMTTPGDTTEQKLDAQDYFDWDEEYHNSPSCDELMASMETPPSDSVILSPSNKCNTEQLLRNPSVHQPAQTPVDQPLQLNNTKTKNLLHKLQKRQAHARFDNFPKSSDLLTHSSQINQRKNRTLTHTNTRTETPTASTAGHCSATVTSLVNPR